jgi:hypothetical protein
MAFGTNSLIYSLPNALHMIQLKHLVTDNASFLLQYLAIICQPRVRGVKGGISVFWAYFYALQVKSYFIPQAAGPAPYFPARAKASFLFFLAMSEQLSSLENWCGFPTMTWTGCLPSK